MAILINNRELALLSGEDHSLSVLYLLIIRPRMDIWTRIVGKKNNFNIIQIKSELDRKSNGVKNVEFYEKKILRKIERLQKINLIELLNKDKNNLIMLCCQANQKGGCPEVVLRLS